MSDSLRPDLKDTTCSIAGCFEAADGVGWLTIKLDPKVGAVPEDDRQTIEFPRCSGHAHLLRMGGEMVEFNENSA